ncbi:MAG TPA: Fe-S cluster assembly protein HesB [Nocardioides sp.]|uniref:Fe-S cluster assembly iron-binding protein IscA n=1 Tax=Nocardioides daedukensis TaxID=634462 RepID=A0A7Y9S001_9ACTN|nr:Fe-S cluster assembly protein HesB [Nocardioides daedukensis]NYG57608.1 Fe-S cluster assembly iron-binding protein IscA [Nocardioides daedukensis]
MLTLTENASTIVKEIANQAEETAGLRISSDAEQAFAVNAVGAAEPGDEVVEQDGATIFLDAPAAEQLGDKVLDAAVDQQGGVQFALAPQA